MSRAERIERAKAEWLGAEQLLSRAMDNWECGSGQETSIKTYEELANQRYWKLMRLQGVRQ